MRTINIDYGTYICTDKQTDGQTSDKITPLSNGYIKLHLYDYDLLIGCRITNIQPQVKSKKIINILFYFLREKEKKEENVMCLCERKGKRSDEGV